MIVRAATNGVVGHGLAVGEFDAGTFARRLADGLAAMPLDGRRVLVIVPDGTRTMPMPEVVRVMERDVLPRVAALDYLVALGTHPPMTDAQLTRHFGQPVAAGAMGASRVFNHEWQDPGTFVTLGCIPAVETAALTGGRLSRDVTVSLNRRILEYNHLLVCGPVFPHEVVGFSGGSKYFFPGIGGQEIIDVTHWLGALITNYDVIGTPDTPVRAVIDRAVAMIAQPISCCALVVTHAGVAGVYSGPLQAAWRAAAAHSAERHIVYVDRPFRRVLSVMPTMYDDIWTAAKGMYKVEPAVADGGEVIIYAPHIDEVSYTHGRLIDEIGYHCRDYFTAQWDRFARYPGGVLAHSTHLKGLGTYDAATGVETPRVQVTLATGIPEARCRRINLGYRDPATIDLEAWRGREDDGVLLIPRAGEMLYRVRSGGPGRKA